MQFYKYKPENNIGASELYAAITPHDTTNLSFYTRGVYVGGTGNVVAVLIDGTTVTFSNVPAGSVLPIAVKRINSTSTTATSLVALY